MKVSIIKWALFIFVSFGLYTITNSVLMSAGIMLILLTIDYMLAVYDKQRREKKERKKKDDDHAK